MLKMPKETFFCPPYISLTIFCILISHFHHEKHLTNWLSDKLEARCFGWVVIRMLPTMLVMAVIRLAVMTVQNIPSLSVYPPKVLKKEIKRKKHFSPLATIHGALLTLCFESVLLLYLLFQRKVRFLTRKKRRIFRAIDVVAKISRLPFCASSQVSKETWKRRLQIEFLSSL